MYKSFLLIVLPWISFAQTLTTSDLPIILLNTNGRNIPDEPKMDAQMGIIFNGIGQINHVSDPTNHFQGRIGIETRGSTSQSISTKKPYSLEARDSLTGLDKDVRLLGMSKESDWSLIAPYSDKTLIRDALMYRLAQDVHAWAPRTRACELLLNNAYRGVYTLTEKIKRDGERVDIAKSNALIPAEGGYIIKIDKTTGISSGWTSTQRVNYLYHYPSPTDITWEQKTYIQNKINEFEQVMQSAQYADTVNGYPKYLNVNTFIDFVLLNEIARNVDGYRLSTYLHKDRDSINTRFNAGPIWDFNIALGNANYCRGERTEGWAWDFNSVCPQDGSPIPFWWGKLVNEPTFRNKMKARWTTLRNSRWTNAYILGLMDSLRNNVQQAQVRNFQKWQILSQWIWPNAQVTNSYSGEVEYLRSWLTARLFWLDGQLKMPTDTQSHPRFLDVPEVFPNPSNSDIHFYYYLHQITPVKILIFNILGQEVARWEAASNVGHQQWTWTKNAAGTYFYQIWIGDELWQKGKLVRN